MLVAPRGVWFYRGMKPFRIFLTRTLAAGLMLVGLAGCITNKETGRTSLNFISESQEATLGVSSFNQMKQQVPISKDPVANALVQKVGQRIAEQAKQQLPNAQWEFIVFESKEANAFCLPGGKIGVYTGILPITKDEAGLATVLGHEVAHATSHHGGARMSRALALQGLGVAVDAGTASMENHAAMVAAYGAVAQVGVELPFSREDESEADRIGLRFMARAGYNPEAAVAFWERFAAFNAKAGSEGVWFLRTHPLSTTRIQQLKTWMPEAKAQYRPHP